MRVFMRTSSTDNNYNPCPRAVVDIDADDLRRIAVRRKIFLNAKEMDKDVYEIFFWGANVSYYDNFDLDEELLTRDEAGLFEDNGYALCLEEIDPDDIAEAQRVECEQLIVREEGIGFFCYPKHCDVHITTETIPWSFLFKDEL